MKCPKCTKVISDRSTICKHCGVRIVRKSDKIARKMTMNGRVAMASGGLLIFIAVILALNNTFGLAGLTFAVGAALAIIGKMMG